MFEHRAPAAVGYSSQRFDYYSDSESVGCGDERVHGEMSAPRVTEYPNGIAIKTVADH